MDNLKRGDAAIGEVQIYVFDILLGEVRSIVGFVIQPNHSGHFQFFEYGHVVVGRKCAILRVGRGYVVLIDGFIGGGAECDELVGDDPVEVSVLDLLVVLVLGQAKGLVVEPPQSDRVLQPPQTVQQLHHPRNTVHL